MFRLALPVTVLSLLIATLTSAQEVGSHALSIVDELSRAGITKVGELDFNAFRAEAKGVRWEMSESAPLPNVAGFRRSAYYLVQEKKVIVTSSGAPESEHALKLLELHETLGVLGYRDQMYAQSGALSLLSKVSDPVLRDQLVRSYGETLFSRKNLFAKEGGGSGSSVGGGGDIAALMLKDRIITEILESGTPLDPDFYIQYPLVTFEPIESPQDQYLWMQHHIVVHPAKPGRIPGVPGDRDFEELVAIIFPALQWQKVELRAAIVKEIKSLLLGIYPTYQDVEVHEIVPFQCPKDIRVRYPKTDDSGIRMIQAFRSGAILGCIHETKDRVWISATFPRWIK